MTVCACWQETLLIQKERCSCTAAVCPAHIPRPRRKLTPRDTCRCCIVGCERTSNECSCACNTLRSVIVTCPQQTISQPRCTTLQNPTDTSPGTPEAFSAACNLRPCLAPPPSPLHDGPLPLLRGCCSSNKAPAGQNTHTNVPTCSHVHSHMPSQSQIHCSLDLLQKDSSAHARLMNKPVPALLVSTQVRGAA
jgi:hypothetical protein